MPSCYRLIKKEGENLKGNAQFIEADELMCKHFGVEPDPVNWYERWENMFGISLATGKSWADLKQIWEGDDDLLPIIDWLSEHYTVDCWHEHKC